MDWRKLFLLQPKERKETFKHMTRGEKWKVHMYNGLLGACMGLTVGVPGEVLLMAVRGSPVTLFDWPTALGILLVGVGIFVPVAIYSRRKLREHMASTEWARSQGYTAHDL